MFNKYKFDTSRGPLNLTDGSIVITHCKEIDDINGVYVRFLVNEGRLIRIATMTNNKYENLQMVADDESVRILYRGKELWRGEAGNRSIQLAMHKMWIHSIYAAYASPYSQRMDLLNYNGACITLDGGKLHITNHYNHRPHMFAMYDLSWGQSTILLEKVTLQEISYFIYKNRFHIGGLSFDLGVYVFNVGGARVFNHPDGYPD